MANGQHRPVEYAIGPLGTVAIQLRRITSWLLTRIGPLLPLLLGIVILVVLVRVVSRAGTSRTVMLYLALWLGFAQMVLLARTRTLSWSTLRSITGIGLGLATFLTLAGMRLFRELLGLEPHDTLAQTMLTPVVEELTKLVPVLALIFLSSRGRSLSLVDIVLAGFLCGLGFGFVEEMSRRPNTWSAWPWHLLAAFPSDPANWYVESVVPHQFSHAVSAAIAASGLAFWWRARRLGIRRWPWAIAACALFVFVTVTHASLDTTYHTWDAVKDWLQLIGDDGALHEIGLVAAMLALSTDLHDARRVHGPTWWLWLRVDRSSPLNLCKSIARNRLERARAMSAVYGAPPRPLDYWTHADARRLAGGGAVLTALLRAAAPVGRPGLALRQLQVLAPGRNRRPLVVGWGQARTAGMAGWSYRRNVLRTYPGKMRGSASRCMASARCVARRRMARHAASYPAARTGVRDDAESSHHRAS